MTAFVDEFGPFYENTWINASSIGAMPRAAYEAAKGVIKWNTTPYYLSEDVFHDVPVKLKESLSRLIGAPEEEIILGNSASYGLHLWANGIPLKKGDEVLLVKGDFPASILPWIYLRKKGIIVKEIESKSSCIQANDVSDALTDSTKVLCATWVDSFTGFRLDAAEIGALCKKEDVLFLLNVTQGLGSEPFNVQKIPVDGITCTGYKWLCGPYATGFSWMKLEHIHALDYNQSYWIPMQGERELDNIREYQILENIGAAQYDVFGTANLFNFVPWTESINLFIKHTLTNIKKHNIRLVHYFHKNLDQTKYRLLSPQKSDQLTAIIIVSHIEQERNKRIFELLQENKIFISYREGYLRFSPHLYNTLEDMDKTLQILNSIS